LSKINLFCIFSRRPSLADAGRACSHDRVARTRGPDELAGGGGGGGGGDGDVLLTGSQPWTSRWAAAAAGPPPPPVWKRWRLVHVRGAATTHIGTGTRRSPGGLYTAVQRRRPDLAPGLYNNWARAPTAVRRPVRARTGCCSIRVYPRGASEHLGDASTGTHQQGTFVQFSKWLETTGDRAVPRRTPPGTHARPMYTHAHIHTYISFSLSAVTKVLQVTSHGPGRRRSAGTGRDAR